MMPLAIYELFEQVCHTFPERTALKFGARHVSYAMLEKRVQEWSKELLCAGLQRRERVLISANDALHFILVWFALWNVGCIPIPLEASASADELQQAAQESRAHWVISSAEFSGGETPAIVSAFFPAWRYSKLDPRAGEEPPEDTALFFYTSGTTGIPKCVMFSHQAILANTLSFLQKSAISQDDVFFCLLAPMLPAALATAVWPVLCSGAELVLSSSTLPGVVLREVATTGATLFFAVPYVYRLLTSAMELRPQLDWRKKLRLCLSSSAFLDRQTFDSFYKQTAIPIRSLYCSSEAGACTYNTSDDLQLLSMSVGQAYPEVRLQVVDSAWNVLPPGKEGQIVVRGLHVAQGYFGRPELQRQVFMNGWVITGDAGMIDAQGYVYLTGRLSETINVSGYLVNPGEVESVLLTHPAIEEVLVTGQTNQQSGEIVVADIVLRRQQTRPPAEELARFCATRLAHYKIPRQFRMVSSLAKSRYGKIKRLSQTASGG